MIETLFLPSFLNAQFVLTWCIIGALNLFLNMLKDMKTMHVDDRKNHFMMGMSMALLFLSKMPLWYIFVVIIGSFLLQQVLFKRILRFGAGDVSAMGWILIGFGVLGLLPIGLFFAGYYIMHSLYFVIASIFFSVGRKKLPYYPIIFGGYVMGSIMSLIFLLPIFW